MIRVTDFEHQKPGLPSNAHCLFDRISHHSLFSNASRKIRQIRDSGGKISNVFGT